MIINVKVMFILRDEIEYSFNDLFIETNPVKYAREIHIDKLQELSEVYIPKDLKPIVVWILYSY